MKYWSEQEKETLKRLWDEGLSASQISLKLPGRSRNSVLGQVHRMDLPYRYGAIYCWRGNVSRYSHELSCK